MRAEFERQSTSNTFERLYMVARARLRMYAGKSRHVNEADVDDVVMNVVTDTLDGSLTWNPEARTLERHLLDAIAFRVRDQARSRARHPHVEYDEDGTGEPLSSRSLETCERELDLHSIADQVVTDIRQRAAGDPEVLLLMDTLADGIVDRAEGIRETRFQPAQYDNALRRLRRLTKQLPKPARDAAVAALTEDQV
ncbi:MAG: hypothetical protein QM831_11855 [Kofleriaceae bacterium]